LINTPRVTITQEMKNDVKNGMTFRLFKTKYNHHQTVWTRIKKTCMKAGND